MTPPAAPISTPCVMIDPEPWAQLPPDRHSMTPNPRRFRHQHVGVAWQSLHSLHQPVSRDLPILKYSISPLSLPFHVSPACDPSCPPPATVSSPNTFDAAMNLSPALALIPICCITEPKKGAKLTVPHATLPAPVHTQPAHSSCAPGSPDPPDWRSAAPVAHGGGTVARGMSASFTNILRAQLGGFGAEDRGERGGRTSWRGLMLLGAVLRRGGPRDEDAIPCFD
jgi:hypothetical protein